MAIRTALLNGNNISRDTDFSKYIESVSEPGVIEGLEVSATKVGIGKAFVPCLRTNGETIYALVYNFSEVTISGNGDVFIEVSQTYIDDGELANEDGTGIATIQVGTMPSKNALKLATISSGTVTDARNMIPKVGELNTQIVSIFDELADLDERVEALEEAGAIDHLEESGLVGELYTLNDTLFKQNTPALADSTLDCNVSDVAANTEIHIQRIASGVASNQLKLKVKMVGSSTQNLKVEVRKGVQVTVTEGVEAYWYGDQVVASGSIPYSEISTSYAEKTITLDNEFGGTKGELLAVVVYMDTVNASNYYCVACDSTQYSEGFSYVSVNGSTRSRSKLMPYCISDGFAQSLFVKVGGELNVGGTNYLSGGGSFSGDNSWEYIGLKTNNTEAGLRGHFEGTLTTQAGGAGQSGSSWGYCLNGTTMSYVSSSQTFSFDGPIDIGKQFYIGYYATSSRYASYTNVKFYTYKALLYKESVINGKLSNIKQIGEMGFLTLLGVSGGKWVNNIISSEESSSAGTGAITPGNYVKYITIKGSDGKDYKVGVYNV